MYRVYNSLNDERNAQKSHIIKWSMLSQNSGKRMRILKEERKNQTNSSEKFICVAFRIMCIYIQRTELIEANNNNNNKHNCVDCEYVFSYMVYGAFPKAR